MSVGSFKLPIITAGSSSGGNLTPIPYVRPADWLPIDHLVNVGDEKFVGLVAVFEEGNFIAFFTTGSCRVDWGDGVVEDYSGGNLYINHVYNYTNPLLDGTECSRGYKQAIITITPTPAASFNRIRFNEQHPQAGLNAGYSNGLLDVKLSSAAIQVINFSVYCRMLEQFDYVGTNNITTGDGSVFLNCISLRNVKNLDVSKFASPISLFQGCRSLEKLPTLNFAVATNFQDAFNGCINLKSVDGLTFNNPISLVRCFQDCRSIIKFPDFVLTSATLLTNMFLGCISMVKNPVITFNVNINKNFSGLFADCVSLTEYTPMINTERATTYASMFSRCSNLRKIDSFATNKVVNFTCDSMFMSCLSLERAPDMNMTTCINTYSMFSGCTNLEYVPDYNLPNNLAYNSMFLNCASLEYAPTFTMNTTSGDIVLTTCFSGCTNLKKGPNWNIVRATTITNMFLSCTNLQSVPDYNLSAVTVTPNTIFSGCSSLYKAKTTGLRFGISFLNAKLGRQALVDIFNGLGTAVGAQTITITGNYGASSLTNGERLIATGKGWTIVG